MMNDFSHKNGHASCRFGRCSYRVLMIGWEFPPCISGGLGTACEGIVGSLLDRGHEVTLVLPGATQVEPRQNLRVLNVLETQAGRPLPVPYLHGPYPFAPSAGHSVAGRYEKGAPGLSEISSPYEIPGSHAEDQEMDVSRLVETYADKVVKMTRNIDFDLIHCHDWLTLSAGRLVKKISGKPLIAHMHSIERDRSGAAARPDIVRAERLGLEEADAIIGVSRISAHHILSDYGDLDHKLEVIHNGVSCDELDKTTDHSVLGGLDGGGRRHVLFLGRITRQKGPDLFLQAAEYTLEKMSDVQFIISGEGDMLDAMIGRVHGRNLSENFIFTGFLPHDQVAPLMSRCDLFVVSSRSEPFGIVALEAAQAGVPVIVPDNAGVREILQHAPVFPAGDTPRLSEAMVRVLGSESYRQRIITKNRRSVRTATWEKVVRNIEFVYSRLVKDACGRLKNYARTKDENNTRSDVNHG